MKAVGKLNDNYPDVPCHGKKHFPQIFRLHFQPVQGFIPVFTGKFKLFQLGHAVYKQGHIPAKFLYDLLLRHDGVLDHIM